MTPPNFWWTTPAAPPARLLAPLGALYGALTATRMARPGTTVGVPVVCAGNLVAGGAGKTPAALALAGMLYALGRRPAFLSRGYGRTRRTAEVLRVDPARDCATDCGDEPLLLADVAPTYVAADRRAAARLAIDQGSDVLIMDDGLQNPALTKDWALAVVDGRAGIGNGLCIPAGPLRAPTDRQWPYVSMLCVVGAGEPGERLARAAAERGVAVIRARLRPDAAVVAELVGRPLLAFAGIGRPGKFYDTLAEEHLDVVDTRSFPDHHAFAAADLDALRRRAEQQRATLITTAKDAARLPPGFPAITLPVTLRFAEPDRIRQALGALPYRI